MFYTERNGGRGFNRVKPNSIRGEKGRQPFCCEWFGTQSQMLQTMRHPQVFRGGPVLISPVLLLCARFFMSHILSVTKVPCRSLIFPCKSYQFQNTHGVLRRCLEEVDSICLGFFFFSFFQSFFLFSGEQGTPFKHLCGFINICCWWKRYPKRFDGIWSEKVSWSVQFAAVSYGVDV